MKRARLFAVALAMSVFAGRVAAAPEDEVRAQLDRFIAAQNAHDLNAVRELLLDCPTFLWITRGTPVRGREAALKRFEALYQGTWKLEARHDELKVTMLHGMSRKFSCLLSLPSARRINLRRRRAS